MQRLRFGERGYTKADGHPSHMLLQQGPSGQRKLNMRAPRSSSVHLQREQDMREGQDSSCKAMQPATQLSPYPCTTETSARDLHCDSHSGPCLVLKGTPPPEATSSHARPPGSCLGLGPVGSVLGLMSARIGSIPTSMRSWPSRRPFGPSVLAIPSSKRAVAHNSLAQTPSRIQKVDPPFGSIVYTIRVWEFRIGGSAFWFLPVIWGCFRTWQHHGHEKSQPWLG